MPRLSQKLPSYRRHKSSGQAIVTLSGRDHYLGPYGTNASKLEYDRVISEWIANGSQLPNALGIDQQITIVELIAAYWKHAKQHYVKNGEPTAEQDCMRSALKPLKELYGAIEVQKFGPLALKAVRDWMIERNWSRDYVNKSLSRIRRMFKWGVENELVLVTVLHALQAIQGLQAGRTNARETPGRHPVPTEHIEAVSQSRAPRRCAWYRSPCVGTVSAGSSACGRSAGAQATVTSTLSRLVVIRPVDWFVSERQQNHFGHAAYQWYPWCGGRFTEFVERLVDAEEVDEHHLVFARCGDTADEVAEFDDAVSGDGAHVREVG